MRTTPTNIRLRLVIMVGLLLVTHWVPTASLAQEGTPEAENVVVEESVPEPTVEVVPTVAPPTAAPTLPPPPPTAAPTAMPPTPMPTATSIPTEPPTEPATEVSTATVTTTDDAVVDQPQEQVAPSTPEVTPTPVPPTPTPVPNTDSLVAISGLEPVSLYPGESHVVGLAYIVTTPRTATAVHAELRLADGTLATGWLLAANAGTQSVAATGPAVDMSEDASVAPDSSFPLLLTITAPADIAVEHTVTLHLWSTEVTTDGETPTIITGDAATVGVTGLPEVVPPTASDFQIACDTGAIAQQVGDAPLAVTCSVNGLDSLLDREATLTNLSITAPAGWEILAGDGTAHTTLTVEPGHSITAGSRYDLAVSVQPIACDAGGGAFTVSSLFTFNTTIAITGPSTEIQAAVSPPTALPPTVDATFLGFGASEWTEAGYTPVTGTVAMDIRTAETGPCAANAASWSLQVETVGLSGSGRQIPASNITYLGSASNSGAPSGLMPLTSDIPLAAGQPVTIAMGDASIGSGGTWNAQFLLTPPDNVPPGSYGGAFEVTIVSGP